MGKYIVDIASPNVRNEYIVYWTHDGLEAKRVSDLTPYTEPEPHSEVTADAYQRGYETAKHECEDCPKQAYTDAIRMEAYQQGLNVLWEAMQKAIKMYCEIDNEVFLRVFHDVKCDWGESVLQALFKNTPQHLIDSIRQYEQEKEEQITKGDIVLIKSTPEVEILVTYADEEYVSGIALTEVDGNCEIGDQYTNIRISNVEKTGKHYDIASVMQKMREESDG